MHILALNMRRPHTFCAYIGLKKLKLLFTCEIFAFYQFLDRFVNSFWKIRGKSLQSVGYSKHNYFLFPPNSDKKKYTVSYIFTKNPSMIILIF